MLPNFLICGTSAGGTSFLTAGMLHHPDIYLPTAMRPEPHFFYYSHKYEKSLAWYEQTWFSEVDGQKAVGERSSSYMYMPNCAPRIQQHLPEAKLIFILRNPIERAWANYRYTVLEGLEDLSFEEALRLEKQRMARATGVWAEVQPHDYTGRGHYAAQLDNFLKRFSRDKMLVLKSEAVSTHPEKHFKDIFRFLGVDEHVSIPTPPVFTSFSVIDPAVQMSARRHFEMRFDPLVEAIRADGDVTPLLISDDDRQMYQRLRENLTNRKDEMPSACRGYLRDLYSDDMRQLRHVTDFETDDWQ